VTSILFGAWLAIQAQSLISIDFPAIAIWGWIFAGIGVGASISQKSNQSMKLSLGRKYLGIFSSIVFSITSIIVITPLARAQSDLQKGFYAQVDKADSESVSTKSNFLIQMEKKDQGNPTLPILSANSLFQDGAFREAANAARRAINIDNHDYRSWWFLASSLEQLGMRKEAIPARLKTIELSPFSSQNLLELARDYASQNDIEGVKNVVGQLGQIDIKSAEYLEASRLVKP
jgi:tetratricopeptide (TPR) repeat protein